MVGVKNILPFVSVLVVASVLLATYFVVNDKFKVVIAEDEEHFVEQNYTDTIINVSSNITVCPRVKEDQWACYNTTDAAGDDLTSLVTLFDDGGAADEESYLGTTDAALLSDTLNCSVNCTDFSAEVFQNLNNTGVAMGEFSSWTDLMAIGIMASIILGLIITALVVRSRSVA